MDSIKNNLKNRGIQNLANICLKKLCKISKKAEIVNLKAIIEIFSSSNFLNFIRSIHLISFDAYCNV